MNTIYLVHFFFNNVFANFYFTFVSFHTSMAVWTPTATSLTIVATLWNRASLSNSGNSDLPPSGVGWIWNELAAIDRSIDIRTLARIKLKSVFHFHSSNSFRGMKMDTQINGNHKLWRLLVRNARFLLSKICTK